MAGLAQQIGAQLRCLRKEAGISQTVIADALGVTQYYVSKIEDGKAPLALERWCQLYAGVLGHKLQLSFALTPDGEPAAHHPEGAK